MDILLETNLNFTGEDNKTHRYVPFSLAKEYDSLHMFFEYSPKTVEDETFAKQIIEETTRKYLQKEQISANDWRTFLPVNNLLTLSLCRNGKYIGCAHRQPPKQHIIISAEISSCGFIPHSVTSGAWEAIISLHAISTPVVCNLRILGEGEH